MRGSRKPRKIDVIREQSEIIFQLKEAYKTQGLLVIELLNKINELKTNSSN